MYTVALIRTSGHLLGWVLSIFEHAKYTSCMCVAEVDVRSSNKACCCMVIPDNDIKLAIVFLFLDLWNE